MRVARIARMIIWKLCCGGGLSVGIQYGLRDVLLQHAVVRVLSVRQINGSVSGIEGTGMLTWRSRDVNIFTIEKTLETRMLSDKQ